MPRWSCFPTSFRWIVCLFVCGKRQQLLDGFQSYLEEHIECCCRLRGGCRNLDLSGLGGGMCSTEFRSVFISCVLCAAPQHPTHLLHHLHPSR